MLDAFLSPRFTGALVAIVLALVHTLPACTPSAQKQEPPAAEWDYGAIPLTDTAANDEPFYPIIPYLLGQIAHVDTTPIAIERIVTIDNRTVDSGYISKKEFKAFTTPFTRQNPQHAELRPYYKEHSFLDQSIGRFTFVIEATAPHLILRQADIHIDPENNRVKHLVMKRQLTSGDSTIRQYLIWEHNMNCQLSEQIEKPNGLSYLRVTKLIWDRPWD